MLVEGVSRLRLCRCAYTRERGLHKVAGEGKYYIWIDAYSCCLFIGMVDGGGGQCCGGPVSKRNVIIV